MAENPMTEREVKRFRVWLKPFSRLNSFVYMNRPGFPGYSGVS